MLPPGAPATALVAGLVAKGLFGVMLVLPVAGLTFRGLGDDAFAHGYQSRNLMRQLAGSFSGALTAILLQERQFANHDRIVARTTAADPGAVNWLASLQAAFQAKGMAASPAHQEAMAQMSSLVTSSRCCCPARKSIGWVVLAVVAAAIVLAQRRLRKPLRTFVTCRTSKQHARLRRFFLQAAKPPATATGWAG